MDEIGSLETAEHTLVLFYAECYPLGPPPVRDVEFWKRFQDWLPANREREDVRDATFRDWVGWIADHVMQEGIDAGELATFQKVGPGGTLQTCFRPLKEKKGGQS
jgi:hypothetical protein